jgi:glycosidase
MTSWGKNPIIYEINTWVWLHELSQKNKRRMTLATVPEKEWNSIADLKIDAVWLMGVWGRSPTGIGIALSRQDLQDEFHQVLPDYSPEDVVGSPYCVRGYTVDERLGGSEGLAIARKALSKLGIRLILDFVPNHVAPDHAWALGHPEYFIQGDVDDLSRYPGSFYEVNGRIFACGRDPYFPPWTDVLQLNAFCPGLRGEVIKTISGIAEQCDGIRCDMAMLVMNDIFKWTWGFRAGIRPEKEYWHEVIQMVRNRYPEVIFIAKAYWDLEWELQRQGFNFCYDKRLYDRLLHDRAASVRLHLLADLSYQGKLLRFIENHDEERAASIFSPEKERAAAITISTLPGAKLFHEGQFEGRKVRLSVFLGRRPIETTDVDLLSFYRKLLKAIKKENLLDGEWQLCESNGWPDNQSYLNLVAWCWRSGPNCHLIVMNLSDSNSQGLVRVPWDELKSRVLKMDDVMSGEVFNRSGDEISEQGLYVDLKPWGYHFLRF